MNTKSKRAVLAAILLFLVLLVLPWYIKIERGKQSP